MFFSKTYEGEHTLEEWLQFFRLPAEIDYIQDRNRLGIRRFYRLSIVLFIISLYCSWAFYNKYSSIDLYDLYQITLDTDLSYELSMSINHDLQYSPKIQAAIDAIAREYLFTRLIPSIFTTLLFGSIVGLYQFLKYIDLSNHLRLFVVPFLMVIKEDVKTTQSINLKLDFKPLFSPKNYLGTDDNNAYYRRIKKSKFLHKWLEGKVKLSDHTLLIFTLQDAGLKIKSVKSKSRGRKVTKNSERLQHLIHLQVGIPSEEASLDPNLKKKGKYLYAHVKDKVPSLSTEDSLPLVHFLGLISNALRNVHQK